jgi:hypothetical protein
MIDETSVPDDSDWIQSPGSDGTYVMALYQGDTLIASRTITTDTSDFATHILTLTDTEKNSITNWADLAIWFTVNDTNTAKIRLSTIYRPLSGTVSLYVRSRTRTL